MAELKAENERLKKELESARKVLGKATSGWDAAEREMEGMEKLIIDDKMVALAAESWKTLKATVQEQKEEIEDLGEDKKNLVVEILGLESEIEELKGEREMMLEGKRKDEEVIVSLRRQVDELLKEKM